MDETFGTGWDVKKQTRYPKVDEKPDVDGVYGVLTQWMGVSKEQEVQKLT
jgi:hypothetical protein